MKVDKPIQRGSWGLEVGQPLYLQEDDPEFRAPRPDLKVSEIHLRVDWQSTYTSDAPSRHSSLPALRRLPQSRAIVFNFKVK
jgi:hypothetical protein